jgi:hypothetical protein
MRSRSFAASEARNLRELELVAPRPRAATRPRKNSSQASRVARGNATEG